MSDRKSMLEEEVEPPEKQANWPDVAIHLINVAAMVALTLLGIAGFLLYLACASI